MNMLTEATIAMMISDAESAIHDKFYSADVACHVKALAAEVTILRNELAAIKRDLATGPLHRRKCHDCHTTHWHSQSVVPGVLCPDCKSQDTRLVKTDE